MYPLIPLALAGLTLLAALPAQAGNTCTFEFQVPADEAATTPFVLGVTSDGACFVSLGHEVDLIPIGPINPSRADGCGTAAPAVTSCAGAVSHVGFPLLAMTGQTSALGLPGSASVSMAWNTGSSTTFTCFWSGPNSGIYGLFVVGGGCGFTSFGSGAIWTLAGSQSAGNAGALGHLSA